MTGSRRQGWLVMWASAVVIAAGLVVGALLLAANGARPGAFSFPGWHIIVASAFGSMGLLLVRRRPLNRIGWLLVLEAAVTAIQFAIDQLAIAGLGRLAEPWAPWAAWLSDWVWIPVISPMPIVFLLFPDGRPLSPRWGRLVPVLTLGVVVAGVAQAITPGALFNFPGVQNPAGIGPPGTELGFVVGGLVILIATGGCVASLLVRWRRAGPDGREQLKWLAFVGIPAVAVASVSVAVPLAGVALTLLGAAMPVAIAIAVLRHRLYDIDELIGRTFVYGLLTAILAGVYAASLKLLQEVFLQVTGTQSDGAVILSTLVTAASFAPLRRALDAVLERRFKPKPTAVAGLELPAGAAVAAMSPTDLESLVRRAVRAELEAVRETE